MDNFIDFSNMYEINFNDIQSGNFQEEETTQDDYVSSATNCQMRLQNDESIVENRKMESMQTILTSLYEDSSKISKQSKNMTLENYATVCNKSTDENCGNTFDMSFIAGTSTNYAPYYIQTNLDISKNLTCASKSEFPQQDLASNYQDSTDASNFQASLLLGQKHESVVKKAKLEIYETNYRQPYGENLAVFKNPQFCENVLLENNTVKFMENIDKMCLQTSNTAFEISASLTNTNESQVFFEQNEKLPEKKTGKCNENSLQGKSETIKKTEKTFKCGDSCDYVSHSEEAIAYHKVQIHGAVMFKCHICLKICSPLNDMTSHYICHHTEEFLRCCMCKKRYTHLSSVYTHRRRVHGNAVRCNSCIKCQQNSLLFEKYRKIARSFRINKK